MSFKFFSTKVTVSFLFMAILTVVLLCDKTGYAPYMISSAVIHEIGHFSAMWICGCKPTEVNLIVGSVQICSPPTSLKYETFILLSGPLANLFLFFVFLLAYNAVNNVKLMEFAVINLIHFVFNILPFCGLDGGSILFILISKSAGYKRAQMIMNFLTIVSVIIVLIFFLISVVKGKANYSVCILCCYLILSVFLKF